MTVELHAWSAGRTLVCVPPDLDPALQDDLLALLGEAASVDAVLDRLTTEGIARTPPFICVAPSGDAIRVVVRGAVSATAHGVDGTTRTIDAGRSATWTDDVVPGVVRLTIDLGPDGARLEWLVATPAPAAAPAPAEAPAEPVPPVPGTPATSDGPPPAAPPATPPAPAEVAPAAPVDAGPSGGPDFTGLLTHTVHRGDRPSAAPAAPVAPPPPPPSAFAPPPAGSEATGPPSGPAPVGLDDTLPPPPSSPPSAPGGDLGATGPAAAGEPPVVPDEARSSSGLGQHDGQTVALHRLPPPPAGWSPSGAPDAVAVGPGQVRAVQCPAGHANPPATTTCARCDRRITDPAVVAAPRPVLARLVFDSGLVVDVDRPQLIGRAPAPPDPTAEPPNLITVPSPEGDLSRLHTAVRIEGWDLLVEDTGSTNGTAVRLPGRDLVRLREHEAVLVVVGTEVVLAGTVRFRVEGPPR